MKNILFALILLSILFSISAFAQIQTDVPALKDVYAKDFYIGCLLSYAHVGFSTDPNIGQGTVVDTNGGYLIKYHMNSMSPGNWMKPENTIDIGVSASAYNSAATQAIKDSINVHPKVRFQSRMIAQLDWAKRQGFTFRGHTLVWYQQTPAAFFRTGYSAYNTRVSKDTMIMRIDNYIGEIIRLIHESWPGLLSAIDVVNEAMADNGSDRIASNEWYTTFGDNSYIMQAFMSAHKYIEQYEETQIKLYYNDYNTHNASKADGIVKICGPIFHAGYLDGIGMQDHDAITSPTAAQWIATYEKFDTICTEMAVTELDVKTGVQTNYPNEAVLTQQANQYGQLFKCFVERSHFSGRGKIISVSKDGLRDSLTMVKNESSSLWDTRSQCKPAFYAVASVGTNYNALDSLTSFADNLQENNYTPGSWSTLSSILISAKNAMAQNYSVSVPAAEALEDAKNSLSEAISNLVITGVNADNNGNNPRVFKLSQNYPNPFNPATQISYSIPKNSYISLKVFNLLGQEVATLFDGIRQAGSYTVKFNGTGLTSGIYFYSLRSGKFVETKRLVLLK